MAGMSNIELCYKCADEIGTLNNMQTLIIPLLNRDIADWRMIIKVVPEDTELVIRGRLEIGKTIKAIRHFYTRFPDLERTYKYSQHHYPRGGDNYTTHHDLRIR